MASWTVVCGPHHPEALVDPADRLKDRAHDRRAGTADAEDVLRRASVIDGFMASNALDVTVARDWQSLGGDLDEQARAYGRHP